MDQELGSQVLESQVLVAFLVLVASQVLGALVLEVQALWVDQELCHQLQLLKLLPKLPNTEPEVELASRHMGLVLVAFLAMVLELEQDLEVQAQLLLLPPPKLLSMVLEELEPWEAWCQVQYQVHCQVQYQLCRELVECQEQVPLQLQLLPPPLKQPPKQVWVLVLVGFLVELVLVGFPVELVLVGFLVELALVVLLVLELVLAVLEEQGHRLPLNLLLRQLPKPSTVSAL